MSNIFIRISVITDSRTEEIYCKIRLTKNGILINLVSVLM